MAWDSSTLLRLEQGQVSKLIFENDAIQSRISNDFDKRCISKKKSAINKPEWITEESW